MLSTTTTTILSFSLAVPPLLPSIARALAAVPGHCRRGEPPGSLGHPPGSLGGGGGAMWDPASQTYAGGTVPSRAGSLDVGALLAAGVGRLRVFGYGSLCWHPGEDGVLSLAGRDGGDDDDGAARRVTTAPGRAVGYRRCWCQRSADHRGTPSFNGIVCTLLSDGEFRGLRNDAGLGDPGTARPSTTEGLIYTVGADLVWECLAELDFREKGGYARDVIDVVEEGTGETVKALLYRGTPDNPAFWRRALLDLPLAAAVMSVAVGPSGPNDLYLFRLRSFLERAAQLSPSAKRALEDRVGDDSTGALAEMVTLLQTERRPYFLFGAGSNEHGQLLLPEAAVADGGGGKSVAGGVESEDGVRELTEMLLVAPRHDDGGGDGPAKESPAEESPGGRAGHEPRSLHAGGGHSALLARGGDLHLWGWNDAGQLGRAPTPRSGRGPSGLDPVPPLSNVKVSKVALGHTHTLVIEKGTGRLFAFGDDGRGQVSGRATGNEGSVMPHVPRTLSGASEERFVDVAAGLFHSAAITEQGELLTWGCGRFGQCLRPVKTEARRRDGGGASTLGRWRAADGSKLVQVACGRRHTVALDDRGRVWTLGDNKYGQLGRPTNDAGPDVVPWPVYGPLGRAGGGCLAVRSGWSHVLALVARGGGGGGIALRGWGRNDRGQLGVTPGQDCVPAPRALEVPEGGPADASSGGGVISIQAACCGAEASHVLDADGNLYSTGWNEHGNLAVATDGAAEGDHCPTWKAASGARVVAPPPSKAERKLFAAGGAHLIAMAI